jgi:hypothetical protein
MKRFRLGHLRLTAGSVAFAFLIPVCAQGQERSQDRNAALRLGVDAPEQQGIIDLPRLQGPIRVDGLSDEPAWQDIEPVPLTMYQPTFRGESDREIELRVAYDDQAIYVAARFYHEDPSEVRAFTLTRDRQAGDDAFSIMLDTFNDNENAVRFTGFPLGTRMDHAIVEDGVAGGAGNLSWNTFWDYQSQITDDGWFGEMRIPLSSLRFEKQPDGTVIMGLLGFTYESARDTRWTYPAQPSSAQYQKVSGYQDVRLRGVEPTNPVYVSPYLLTSRAMGQELAPDGTVFVANSERSTEIGGDVKLTPTPNLTLDLTVNTDFAAVEADQQQVNLTRFSLFFEEKRLFFQERAGIFGFQTGADRGTLFHSRRIGLDGGRPIRLLGGARLVGRAGSWDLGVIAMQTDRDEATGRASENFGVLRLRRQVLNPYSFVGTMGTSRIGRDGRYNVTYGVDGLFRLFGDDYLTLKWVQTFQGGDTTLDMAPTGLDAGRIVLDWTRRSLRGLSYQNVYVWSGPGYLPGIGYEPRSNFTRAQSDWNYSWFPGTSGALRRIWIGAENNVWIRNDDDQVDTGQLMPFVQLETRNGVTLKFSTTTAYENVPDTFDLSDGAIVPAGRYWATQGSAELRAARGWPIRPNVTLRAGEFFDGTRFGTNLSFDWPMSPHLEISGGWVWDRIRFTDRGQSFDSNLIRLNLRAALDTHFSVDAFSQYNTVTDRVSTNTRVRYNFREGQDLWLVWNEALVTERDVVGLPRLPFEEARTLTLKYTHTLVF